MMELALVILLVLAGVMLLILEVFFIPGIGWAGLFGIGAFIGGIVVAYLFMGPFAGHITLASSLVLIAVAVWLLLKLKTLDKMALKTDVSSKVDLTADLNINVGDSAITISRLAPMGKVRVNGAEVEAKSESDFVDQGVEVVVTAVNGNVVNVKIKENK